MSNTNNSLQTQTSNALHNPIMKAGGKDHPPMVAPGNYNPPYKFKWTERTIPVVEGSSETTIESNKLVNSLPPLFVKNCIVFADDDEMSKEKEIDKLMALISLSFKKIYKPTNNNLRTSSNTSRENLRYLLKINRRTRDDTDDEPEDQKLEAHYMYMAQIQEVTSDVADNSGPIFDVEPL
ncbi:hypothetical protein Tco_1438806 [Tanacetum coccineum]